MIRSASNPTLITLSTIVLALTPGVASRPLLGAAVLQPTAAATGVNRIEWDQTAPSALVLSRYAFRLYVNGEERILSEVRCDAAGRAPQFVCSGRLPPLPPGTQLLAVAAALDDVEGEPSVPLRVEISASNQAAAAAPAGAPGPSRAACFSGAAPACFTVTRVAESRGRFSLLTAAPDGRLFVIENERQVRILDNGVLLPDAALRATAPGQRLAGLAFDNSYLTSRAVFVLSIEEPAPARAAVTVTRFRELHNRFGQGAVVVPALAAPAVPTVAAGVDGRANMPLLAADDNDFLYLALPVPPAADQERAAGVLRFTVDGATPWPAGQTSLGFARGYPESTAMTFDPVARRMWIAGRDVDRRVAMQSLGVDRLFDAVPVAAQTAVAGGGTIGLAIAADASGGGRYLVSIDADGVLRRRLRAGGSIGEVARLEFPYGTPAALAAGPGGTLYLATEPPAGGQGSSLFLLRPVALPPLGPPSGAPVGPIARDR